MRTAPSGLSSARSMRTPLEPTSMTERIEGALKATFGAGGTSARSATGLQRRFQIELLLEEVPTLLPHRPFVQRHVPARTRLQDQLRIALLRGDLGDPLP